MSLDFSTATGRRALERIKTERVIWLTTSSRAGVPQPRPVWFIWQDASFLIYSLATTHKAQHIRLHPEVALHFDAGPSGTDIQVFHGEARIDPSVAPVRAQPDYVQKYRAEILEMGMTVDSYSASFVVALRIVPTRLRGLMPLEEELNVT